MARFSKFEQSTPPPGYVDTEVIRLTREGLWLADGKEITHEATRKLFARSLKKDEVGYFLHIGHEMKRIEVEDTAYFVEGLEGTADLGYELRINDGTRQPLEPKTLQYEPGRLTCQLVDGDEAKFLSSPYREILQGLEEDHAHYFLRIKGVQITLTSKT